LFSVFGIPIHVHYFASSFFFCCHSFFVLEFHIFILLLSLAYWFLSIYEIFKYDEKELDWNSYTLHGLKRYCENLNVAASDDKDDMIKKLQIVQPRCIMNEAPLVNVILQIYGYMIWSGASVGIMIDKINKDDKIFNIKVYKMLKMESFKDAMLELVRITKYAKTLAHNEKILR
ncbi:hypothetical protein RFI_35585, partial [Reticulomyxa filosa]